MQCNKTVKFTDLFEEAKRLKADALVTGHYVKSVTDQNNTDMYRGVDPNRDQSYFLFNTTKDQLNFLRFPLGNLLKDEIDKSIVDKELEIIKAEIVNSGKPKEMADKISKGKISKFINTKVLKLKLILVSTLIAVAVISIPVISWPGSTFKFIKHALEWDYFLGVITFYLLTYFMWKKKN